MPTTWLGTPDYQLMPTLNCNPAGGSKPNQYINPLCFGVPMPGGPTTGPICGRDREPDAARECTGCHTFTDPRIRITIFRFIRPSAWVREETVQLHASAFNFLNHPLTSFNNNDNTNLNMGNLNFAVAGQPLTPAQLRSPSFGIANIKYGSRLMELGAKFTF